MFLPKHGVIGYVGNGGTLAYDLTDIDQDEVLRISIGELTAASGAGVNPFNVTVTFSKFNTPTIDFVMTGGKSEDLKVPSGYTTVTLASSQTGPVSITIGEDV